MFWNVVLWVGSLVLSSLLRPKPPSVAKPMQSDVRVPVAEEGKEIGWLFGTDDIESANIVWWGDFRAQAIKKKGGKK